MSQKEKLKFRIQGKNIVYEGYTNARVKDLFDILAKMNVEDNLVVPTFRENIPEAADTSDAAIMQQFEDAKRIRREKKKKAEEGGAAAPAAAAAADPQPLQASNSVVITSASAEQPTAVAEQKSRITLVFKGKTVSYEGYPSQKQSALLEFIAKNELPDDVAVTVFRENLPAEKKSDSEILALVNEAKAARDKRKAERDEKKTKAPPQQAAAPSAAPSQPSQAQSAQLYTTNSIGEFAAMSDKERDQINEFIRTVLDGPQTDVATRLRAGPAVTAPAPSAHGDDSNEMATSQRRDAAAAGQAPQAASTGASDNTNSAKVTVYCQEVGTTVSKLIIVPKNTSFDDFLALVEKKFGSKMVLSFIEGEDTIDIDDDEVLQMFFESPVDAGKKLRLLCAPPDSRRRVVDDSLTETAGHHQAPPPAAAAAAGGSHVTGAPPSRPPAPPAPPVASAVPQQTTPGMHKEQRTFTGHTAAVYCCAFSHKGDKFCSASRDRSVRVWNIQTGGCSVMKGGHNGFVLSCDFSPSGEQVVSSSDDTTIKVWNVSTCQKTLSLKGHDDKVYCVQYNSTGAYIVSGSCDTTVRVWNADTGSKQVHLKGHKLAVFSVCFSNTDAGRFVASGSDDRLIKIWEWREGREVRSLIGHTGTVWSCRYSHSDKFIVSASMDHEIRLWDTVTGGCVRTMTGHMTPIHHAVFSKTDKYILSCARDWTTMVWNTETGQHVDTLQGHRNTVYHMDLVGDQLLTSSLDDTIKLWQFDDDVEPAAETQK